MVLDFAIVIGSNGGIFALFNHVTDQILEVFSEDFYLKEQLQNTFE